MSRYIIENKSQYYELLQSVRDNDEWEDWIVFILHGIQLTSLETITTVHKIRILMFEYKNQIKNKYKFYSHELLNNLFRHIYTKSEFLEKDIGRTRKTASKYLNKLVEGGFLFSFKIGKEKFYINSKFEFIYNFFHLK